MARDSRRVRSLRYLMLPLWLAAVVSRPDPSERVGVYHRRARAERGSVRSGRVLVDGDLAIVMGAETVRPIGRAPLAGQTVKRRFTHVWRKGDDGWRLIASYANIVPRPR